MTAAATIPQRSLLGVGEVTDMGAVNDIPDQSDHPFDAGPPVQPLSLAYEAANLRNLRVEVDGLETVSAHIALKEAAIAKVGTVLFFSPSHGGAWYSDGVSSVVEAWFDDPCNAGGWDTIMVRWIGGWAGPGSVADADPRPGPARCAARLAALIRYLIDTYAGGLPMVLVGSSGGSSQVAYALCHYGIGPIVERVVLVSGPPHAAMLKGGRGDLGYNYTPAIDPEGPDGSTIDEAWGYAPGLGPTTLNQEEIDPGWYLGAVDTGATYLSFDPDTPKLFMLIGGRDATVIPRHARDMLLALTPSPEMRYAPLAPHGAYANIVGRTHVFNMMTQDPLDPGLRQSVALDSHPTALASWPMSLDQYVVKTGNLLLFLARFEVASAGVDIAALTAAGWTMDQARDFGARCLLVGHKAIVTDEHAVTITLPVAKTGTVLLMEIDGFDTPTIDVNFGGAQSLTDTYQIGPTSATTAAREFAIAVTSGAGGRSTGDWTADYIEIYDATSGIAVATKNLSATGVQETTNSHSISSQMVGALITIKDGP